MYAPHLESDFIKLGNVRPDFEKLAGQLGMHCLKDVTPFDAAYQYAQHLHNRRPRNHHSQEQEQESCSEMWLQVLRERVKQLRGHTLESLIRDASKIPPQREAQLSLSDCYMFGLLNAERNMQHACQWSFRAANGGLPEACVVVANTYKNAVDAGKIGPSEGYRKMLGRFEMAAQRDYVCPFLLHFASKHAARAGLLDPVRYPCVVHALLARDMSYFRERSKEVFQYKCFNPFCTLRANSKSLLHKCSGCLTARYCSQRCSKEHWKNGHREECSALKMHVSSHSAAMPTEEGTSSTLAPTSEGTLLDSVREIRTREPDLTVKAVHTKVILTDAFADVTLQQVKRASRKIRQSQGNDDSQHSAAVAPKQKSKIPPAWSDEVRDASDGKRVVATFGGMHVSSSTFTAEELADVSRGDYPDNATDAVRTAFCQYIDLFARGVICEARCQNDWCPVVVISVNLQRARCTVRLFSFEEIEYSMECLRPVDHENIDYEGLEIGMPLRYRVGQHVFAKTAQGWQPGMIVALYYAENNWHPDAVAPYQIMLASSLVFAIEDTDDFVKARPQDFDFFL